MAAQPTDRTPLFSAWLASWPEVRRELAAVLDAYERRHPTYDPGWVEPVFAMMDTTLNNLAHRTQWLQAKLDRDEPAHLLIDDDAFYAMLAEAQVD